MWRAAPLEELREESKHKLQFFSSARQVAENLPAETHRDVAAFLKKISIIVLQNSGVLREEAIFGALQAWLHHACLKHDVDRNGIRYTPGAKDFILGSHLVSPRSKRFNDVALLKKGPSRSTLYR